MPAAWRGFRWQSSCLQSFVRPEKQYLGFPYSILLRHLYICPHDIHAISETLFVLELEYGTNSAMRTTLDGVPTHRPRGDEFCHYFRGGGGQLWRTQMSRRFLPKRRASIDRAPGPRIARAIPNVAIKIVPRGWSVLQWRSRSHSALQWRRRLASTNRRVETL